MWNYLKSYAKFCSRAVEKELLKATWFGSVKTTYKVVAFIATIILAWWSLREIIQMLPPLGKRWWAIIALSLIIVSLLTLIGVIKRFHERITSELTDVHAVEISEWRTHTDIIYRLSILYGMALQADDIINFFRNSLPKDRIQYLDANINSGIHNCLGTQARDNYYENMRDIPDSPDDQSWWIRAHCAKLEALIKWQRQKQSIKDVQT